MVSATEKWPQTPVWTSETSLELPDTDIVSFAFGKVATYDVHKPEIFVNAEDPSKFVTASEARDLVKQICKALAGVGLKSGDCVTICSFNNILYPCLWLGVIGTGGIVSGVNPALTLPELKHHITITGTKFLIIHRTCCKRLDITKAAAECGIPKNAILSFGDDLGDLSDQVNSSPVCATSNDVSSTILRSKHSCEPYIGLKDLLEGQKAWRTLKNDEARTTPALHATTSGTTGLPKAAVIPHRYLVSQSAMLEDRYTTALGRSSQEISQLLCLPIFHAFAGNAAFVLPLRCGVTTYFLPRFHLPEYIDSVLRFGITDTLVVPPIISSLVQQGEKLGTRLHSLQRLTCAGAPMNPEVQRTLYNHLSSACRIAQCWGTTETGWVTLTPVDELDCTGSVGKLTANFQLKLVSDDGSVISREGERGEALIKSTAMFFGYRDNPAANGSAFDFEGFYRTGDRAYYKDGKIFIEGRIKDIMKVNGWQVSPEELEEKILAHPNVADCAVVACTARDAAGLEETVPRAFVVLTKDARTDGDDICAWTAARSATYKHLKGGVLFVDEIPRNASGKILRRKLTAGDGCSSCS